MFEIWVSSHMGMIWGGKGLLMGPHLKSGQETSHTHKWLYPKFLTGFWSHDDVNLPGICNHRTTSALAEPLRRQHQASLVRMLHKKIVTDLMESSKPIEWVSETFWVDSLDVLNCCKTTLGHTLKIWYYTMWYMSMGWSLGKRCFVNAFKIAFVITPFVVFQPWLVLENASLSSQSLRLCNYQ